VRGFAARSPLPLAALGALAALNATLGLMLATAQAEAVMLALVPVVIIAVGTLIASNRAVLILAALAIDLLAPVPVNSALPLPIGVQVYLSDVLVLVAVASWVAAWLVNPAAARPSFLGSRVLGWPLLIFGLALLAALVHGHLRYGTSVVSLPLRLLVYAGIAAAMTDLTAREAYRSLVVLFYAGTVWQALVAIHGIATGTSATDAVELSTGGERILAGSTAMFMVGTLLLALLNLEADRRAAQAPLHLFMLVLATFALITTFSRATFAAVVLLVPVFLVVFRGVGSRTAGFLPLAAPFVAVAVLLVPLVDFNLFPTFVDRVTANLNADETVDWRRKAYATVWAQIREAPVAGSGFGRETTFTVDGTPYTIIQDPHNQFLYLWAGGGLILLASFILLLGVYLAESWRRFRTATGDERRLIVWAVSMWFVLVVNSLTGAVLTVPHLLLVFWVILLLPMVVRPEGMRPEGRGAAQVA
jgi:O-antigen ligase